ncbi:trace amine-associated receptor 4-like [Protopterus annectens]|uniref:trace amine-associated receptor 4-like n=1 Tax=Protopterus annectens TaxID=7888 RepID=UPI001CFC1670|nr:trace amine-associated receptor 4-like [Protopterus annectens]
MVGLIIIVVCGNLVVIISVSHFRQLHSPTNFLTLSLAITDFFVGLLILPFSMTRSIETCWYFGNTFCKIHSVFDMVFTTVSILHLCFIAIDRYYAICDPLHYSSKITFPVTAIFLSLCWTVPTCLCFGVVFTDQKGDDTFLASVYCEGLCFVVLDKLWALIILVSAFFLPGALMISIYIKIFTVARNHSAVINGIAGTIISPKEKHRKGSQKVERKAAKTLGLITGVFLFCWLPLTIALLLERYFSVSVSSEMYEFLGWLAYFNSACNPVIYGFFYPWFRRAFKVILSGRIFAGASSCSNLFPENH